MDIDDDISVVEQRIVHSNSTTSPMKTFSTLASTSDMSPGRQRSINLRSPPTSLLLRQSTAFSGRFANQPLLQFEEHISKRGERTLTRDGYKYSLHQVSRTNSQTEFWRCTVRRPMHCKGRIEVQVGTTLGRITNSNHWHQPYYSRAEERKESRRLAREITQSNKHQSPTTTTTSYNDVDGMCDYNAGGYRRGGKPETGIMDSNDSLPQSFTPVNPIPLVPCRTGDRFQSQPISSPPTTRPPIQQLPPQRRSMPTFQPSRTPSLPTTENAFALGGGTGGDGVGARDAGQRSCFPSATDGTMEVMAKRRDLSVQTMLDRMFYDGKCLLCDELITFKRNRYRHFDLRHADELKRMEARAAERSTSIASAAPPIEQPSTIYQQTRQSLNPAVEPIDRVPDSSPSTSSSVSLWDCFEVVGPLQAGSNRRSIRCRLCGVAKEDSGEVALWHHLQIAHNINRPATSSSSSFGIPIFTPTVSTSSQTTTAAQAIHGPMISNDSRGLSTRQRSTLHTPKIYQPSDEPGAMKRSRGIDTGTWGGSNGIDPGDSNGLGGGSGGAFCSGSVTDMLLRSTAAQANDNNGFVGELMPEGAFLMGSGSRSNAGMNDPHSLVNALFGSSTESNHSSIQMAEPATTSSHSVHSSSREHGNGGNGRQAGYPPPPSPPLSSQISSKAGSALANILNRQMDGGSIEDDGGGGSVEEGNRHHSTIIISNNTTPAVTIRTTAIKAIKQEPLTIDDFTSTTMDGQSTTSRQSSVAGSEAIQLTSPFIHTSHIPTTTEATTATNNQQSEGKGDQMESIRRKWCSVVITPDGGDATETVNGGEGAECRAKRADYLSWDEFFMGTALLAAQRSKDPCTQVGAVICNADNIIVSIGYNGMPIGCRDDEMPWGKEADDPLANKYFYVCHAEMNAILNKNSCSLRGSTIYSTMFPCNECAKLIIQSRISCVVYLADKPNKVEMMASRRLFAMTGTECRQFTPQRPSVELSFVPPIHLQSPDKPQVLLPQCQTERHPLEDRDQPTRSESATDTATIPINEAVDHLSEQ